MFSDQKYINIAFSLFYEDLGKRKTRKTVFWKFFEIKDNM